MSTDLTVTVTETDSQVEIHVHGEVDMAGLEELRNSIEPHLGPRQTIVMDLSQVTFADSTLLKVLVVARGELAAAGGSLLLRYPSEQTRRLLTVGELESLIHDEADRQNDER